MFIAYGWKQTRIEFESDAEYCPSCGESHRTRIKGHRAVCHISGLPLGGWSKHWTSSCQNCGNSRKLRGKEAKAAAVRNGHYAEYFRFARVKELLSLAIILTGIGLILTLIGSFGNQQTVYNATAIDFNVKNADTRVTFNSVVLLDYFATNNDENDNVTTYYFAGIFTGGDGNQYLASFEIGGLDDLFAEAEAYLSDSSLQMGDFVVPVYGQLDVMNDDISGFYDKYVETLSLNQALPKVKAIHANIAYIAPALEDSKADDRNNVVVGVVLLLPGILLLGIYISKPRRIQNSQMFH